MTEYFHIPPEDGWEENTYYVCEVSKDREFSGVFNPLMDQKFSPLKNFKYIKAIHKIDMTIPNKDKQIKELNIFELKDHMKERPDVRFN